MVMATDLRLPDSSADMGMHPTVAPTPPDGDLRRSRLSSASSSQPIALRRRSLGSYTQAVAHALKGPSHSDRSRRSHTLDTSSNATPPPSSRDNTSVRSQPAPTPRSGQGRKSSERGKTPESLGVLSLRTANTAALPTIMEHKLPAQAGDAVRNRMRGNHLKKWDTGSRTTTAWDSLHRDPDLWYKNGTCLVHLCAFGQSKRGASYCIPVEAIHDLDFAHIFKLFASQAVHPTHAQPPARPPRNGQHSHVQCEIYIPAPDGISKDATFAWHLQTRNFFAFLLRKPLVGNHLGETMIELQNRINHFRPNHPDNNNDMLDYLDTMGYLDFTHNPDYSLGTLMFAEHFRIHDLWVDAFAHCVGMNALLSDSPEFENTFGVTKAMITRSYLEMDLHLTRATRALSNFLEDVLSPTKLGLSPGPRAHLERFRSFLHSFYVEKFGYWPPPPSDNYPKAAYQSMYFDFRHLYDFLVDLNSTDQLQAQKPASGGVCVLQNVQAFDQRHDYIPLPHPLPLTPMLSSDLDKSRSTRPRLTLKFGAPSNKNEHYHEIKEALEAATNSRTAALTNSTLVKAYDRFEKEWSRTQDEKVSITDARKVRWLLIYSILQVLISVMRAPKEVRDTEGPSYPMCCAVAREAPWTTGNRALTAGYDLSVNVSTPAQEKNSILSASDQSSLYTITPDCEEGVSSPTRPNTLAVVSPLTNNGSLSSFDHYTSSRNSSKRSLNSVSTGSRNNNSGQSIKSTFCEIVVQGYGNGMNEPIITPDMTPVLAGADESIISRPTTSSTMDSTAVEEATMLSRSNTLRQQKPNFIELPPRNPRRPNILTPPTNVDQSTPVIDVPRTPTLEDLNRFDIQQPPTPPLDPSFESRDDGEELTVPGNAAGQPNFPGMDIPGIKPAAAAKVRRNGSLNSDSSTSTSSGSVLSPVTPVDETGPDGAQRFDFGFGTPSLQRPEALSKISEIDDVSSGMSDADDEDATPPGHGIRIKRTFSVESMVVSVREADRQIRPSTTSDRKRRHRISSRHDYLRNNLNRTGSISSVQSTALDRSHHSAGFSLPRSLSRKRSNTALNRAGTPALATQERAVDVYVPMGIKSTSAKSGNSRSPVKTKVPTTAAQEKRGGLLSLGVVRNSLKRRNK